MKRTTRWGWILLAVSLVLAGCRAAAVDPTTASPVDALPAETPAAPSPAAQTAIVPAQAVTPATETPVPPTPIPTPTPIPVSRTLAATGFRLPLAVQHTTDTTAELLFELAAPADGLVIAWAEDAPAEQRSWPLDPAAARQTLVLDGLTPGTRYQTQVVLRGDEAAYQPVPYEGQAWGTVEFRTAGGERDGEPLFRVGAFGDSGFGDSVTYQLAEEMAGYDLDFAIQTGDAVYRMYDEDDPYISYARKWFLPLKPLIQSGPVYPVVGNHDIEPAAQVEGVPFYYSVFPPLATADSPVGPGGGRQWYAVERGDVQILLLDTQTFFGEAGRAEQDEWLAARLADGRFAHTIVVHHVPPFSTGEHPEDGFALRDTWLPQYEASNVRVALSGHEHNYERLEQNAITYLVTGGGSATLYNQTTTRPQSAFFIRRSHFVLLEVWPNRIEFRAIAAGGEVLEGGTIPLP